MIVSVLAYVFVWIVFIVVNKTSDIRNRYVRSVRLTTLLNEALEQVERLSHTLHDLVPGQLGGSMTLYSSPKLKVSAVKMLRLIQLVQASAYILYFSAGVLRKLRNAT